MSVDETRQRWRHVGSRSLYWHVNVAWPDRAKVKITPQAPYIQDMCREDAARLMGLASGGQKGAHTQQRAAHEMCWIGERRSRAPIIEPVRRPLLLRIRGVARRVRNLLAS